MHGIIAIGIVLSIELLVLIASMHLLAKAKGGTFGKLFNWITNLAVLASILLILGTVTAGICRHCCNKGKGECRMEMEKCMMGGKGCHMMMWKGGCDGMSECHGMMKGECGEMEGGHEGNMENCPYDKNGKCMGDEAKCKEMMKDGGDKDGKASKDTSKKAEVKKK
jgi:hypothetical protein